MPTVNAHKVLYNAPTDDDFLENIQIEAKKKKSLIQARDLIREHLKQGLRDWDKTIAKDQLFEGRSFNHIDPPALRPKFRMQGSFSYKTVNDPALQPPQEVDLDDGVFLPIGFLEKNGSASPMVASKGFFKLIEALLAPLCKEKGWVLNGEKPKPSCVRIIIPGGVILTFLYMLSLTAHLQL